MSKGVQMAILATVAILLNSVCFCIGAVSACPGTSCETHDRQGDCPAHQHQHSCGGHACCQVGARNSPSQIRAEGSDRSSPSDSVAFAVGVPVAGICLAVARAALAKEHSPPS